MVLLFNNRKAKKFGNNWNGPYVVEAKISSLVYRIRNVRNRKDSQKVNIQRLKLFNHRDDLLEEFVEKIMDEKEVKGDRVRFPFDEVMFL